MLIAQGELEMSEENWMAYSMRDMRLKARNVSKHMPKVHLRGH
jgi:hypothetical protein